MYFFDKTKTGVCIKCINNSCSKCNHCNNWLHLKCSGLTKSLFDKLSTTNETWYCKICYSDIFPFHNIDNRKLANTMQLVTGRLNLHVINTTNLKLNATCSNHCLNWIELCINLNIWNLSLSKYVITIK